MQEDSGTQGPSESYMCGWPSKSSLMHTASRTVLSLAWLRRRTMPGCNTIPRQSDGCVGYATRRLHEPAQKLTQVLELPLLRVVQLRALDDDSVRREIHAPGQRGSRAQHLSATHSGLSESCTVHGGYV